MNEKILFQLLDTMRGFAQITGNVGPSLVLQLLCWWKLSKEKRIPAKAFFALSAFEPLPKVLAALREAEASMPYPFIDEGIWQSLRDLRDLRPVTEKIQELDDQGFLDSLELKDAAFWLSDTRSGVPAMSPSLAELIVALAKLDDTKSTYAPWDYSGQLASRAILSGSNTWIETPYPWPLSPILNSIAHDGWSLSVGDPIVRPSALDKGKLKQFDCAICFPPMGVRYNNEIINNDLLGRFVEKTPVGNVVQIRHLLAQVKGRIVTVVPNSILFGAGAERQLREHLVSSGLIEAVISLPPGLCSNTNVAVTVLILNTARRTQHIRFVNADSEQFRALGPKKKCELIDIDALTQLVAATENTEQAASIAPEEIASNDFNLEISRYILDDQARRLNAALQKHPFARLGDFFEIIRPRQHATAASGVPVFEVQTADVPEFGYLANASKEALFDLGSPKASTYFLREDDVLLSFRGLVGKVAVTTKTPRAGEGGWIAGQSFLILRAAKSASYSPKALAVYLRSELGQALLNRMTVVSTMPSLQVSALKELEIPNLSQEEVNRMVQAFEQEAHIQSEIQHLRDKQAALATGFWRL